MTSTVLMAGLFHETHTFLAQTTTLADFRAGVFAEGAEMLMQARGNGSPMDGALEVADDRGWQVVPSIQMSAMPGGMVTAEAVDRFEARFFADLEANLARLDAIFLILHGAMVSEGCDDVEGHLLARIARTLRAAGREIPVVGVLDLHANVSQAMIDNSTLLVAYRENPHSDARETAVRAARLLDDLLVKSRAVHQLHLPTPYVLPPTGVGSAANPMRAVLDRARAIEAKNPDVIGINVMAGYSYADIPDCGFSLNAPISRNSRPCLKRIWPMAIRRRQGSTMFWPGSTRSRPGRGRSCWSRPQTISGAARPATRPISSGPCCRPAEPGSSPRSTIPRR
jgi:microcystin degradation protein MlrC